MRGEEDASRIRRNFSLVHGFCEPANFANELRLELAQQRSSRLRFHSQLFNARLRMKNLVAPLFSGRAKMENRYSFRCLQTKFAVHSFCRFNRGERNLQSQLSAKQYLARFEQCLSF